MSGAVRLAVLGDPLAYTRSPDLHRAGLAAVGLAGESLARRTPIAELGATLAELAAAGFTGVNLTHPLKEAALDHVTRASEPARRARSVNTVGFTADGAWGDSTDGPGLLDSPCGLGRDPARERAVLLGAGGAARSLALALASAGAAASTVSARNPERAGGAWAAVPGARRVAWRSADERQALGSATLVINATPLGGAEHPAPLAAIAASALILDLVYGAEVTPWVRAARAEGREACDGLGLLVHQAAPLELRLKRPVPRRPRARRRMATMRARRAPLARPDVPFAPQRCPDVAVGRAQGVCALLPAAHPASEPPARCSSRAAGRLFDYPGQTLCRGFTTNAARWCARSSMPSARGWPPRRAA